MLLADIPIILKTAEEIAADPAGFTGTTWPVTSQSKRWRIAASRCLTLGAASSRVPASIQVATCTGYTASIDATPAVAHQAKNSSAARA